MGTRKDKILQKLNPKLLKMTPKLSGDSGSFIDLDCDDSLEDGARNLMMRFFRNQDLCEKNKRNLQKNVTDLSVSSTKHSENNEICELISERLSLPFTRSEEDDLADRPGRRLQKLKMELQEKMSAKWEEEYKKRVNENKVGYEPKSRHQKKCSDDDEEDEEDDVDKDNSDDRDSIMENISEAENDDSKDVTKNINVDNHNKEYMGDEEDFESDGASVASVEENNESSCEDNQEDQTEKDDAYDDADSCSLVPAYQPGGGMLYGGSELTQCDDGLPQSLLSPSLRLSMNELSGPKISSECLNDATPKKPELGLSQEANSSFVKKHKLFSQAPNDSFDLSEAFEFCSGKFPDAESRSQLSVQQKLQVSDDEYEVQEDEEEEEEEGEDDNGSEDKLENSFRGDPENEDLSVAGKDSSKARKNIIAFEDSEGEEEDAVKNGDLLDEAEEFQSTALKLLSDEDEDEDAVESREVKKKNKKRKNLQFSDEEDATNDGEDEIDGDSDVSEKEDEDIEDDCEERSVHYDSEENEIINPKEFFEKEAELSGEEWSGDEDERGLDEFDFEEGDVDKLDEDQVRSQLEKIHIRRVLDDDAREVRLIQEILFEDGDLHSDGKKRDRKFKWKNLGTFSEQGNEGEPKEEGGNSSEDDGAEEEALRKIRHEKELFLMTKKKEGDLSSDEEIVEDFHTIKVTSIKNSIKVSARTENTVEATKAITDFTAPGKTSNLSNTRGSFLTRNEEFLSRLAKASSGTTDNILGPKTSKNFVFATKSPEKVDPDRTTACKRQVDDSGNCGGRDKKIKLFPPKIDTGPSILDLLA